MHAFSLSRAGLPRQVNSFAVISWVEPKLTAFLRGSSGERRLALPSDGLTSPYVIEDMGEAHAHVNERGKMRV
jgi:hypothetical protein